MTYLPDGLRSARNGARLLTAWKSSTVSLMPTGWARAGGGGRLLLGGGARSAGTARFAGGGMDFGSMGPARREVVDNPSGIAALGASVLQVARIASAE